MQRKVASYLTMGAIAGGILSGIGCEKEPGSSGNTTRSDASKPAPDVGERPSGVSDASLVIAVEYVSGANHDSEAVDDGSINAVNVMWRIASMTSGEKGAKAFAGSQANKGAPVMGLPTDPPAYEDCEAESAEPEALNDLLPVLFQHLPGTEARAEWTRLREHVRSGDLVSVTCANAPEMVVAVTDGRIVAAREALEMSEEPERLVPSEDPTEQEPELIDSLPEAPGPDDRPSADLKVTSLVDGSSIVIDGTEAELPHQMTAIDPSTTIRFKVKAPAHLEAEVGALPMDVFGALQGGEIDRNFVWAVWPNPVPPTR